MPCACFITCFTKPPEPALTLKHLAAGRVDLQLDVDCFGLAKHPPRTKRLRKNSTIVQEAIQKASIRTPKGKVSKWILRRFSIKGLGLCEQGPVGRRSL